MLESRFRKRKILNQPTSLVLTILFYFFDTIMLKSYIKQSHQLYKHCKQQRCLARLMSTSTTKEEKLDIHRIPPQLKLDYYATNVKHIVNNMTLRNYDPDVAYRVKDLYDERLRLTSEATTMREARDRVNMSIRTAQSKQDREHFIQEAKSWKEKLRQLEDQLVVVESELEQAALQVPNETHPETPLGPESNARLLKTVGEPRKDTSLKDHVSIAEQLDMIDFEQASLVTGSKFYYLKNYGAWLEFALIQYALHKASSKGFSPVITPDMVRTSIAYGCGFQPRKSEASQIYDVSTASTVNTTAPKLCLVGTAEIPLAGLNAQKLFKEEELPKRIVGFSHAFRAEAGHGSAEERGLYRVHQFSKVELFTVTTPQQSESMLQEMRELQEEMFTELGLCFRILDMPTEELGASAYRKYDMEAWMPGKNGWGEVK